MEIKFSMILGVLLITLFVLLIKKREKLGRGIGYFISAIGVCIIVDIISKAMKINNMGPTVTVNIIGILLLAFLFIFLYFIHITVDKKFRTFQIAILVIFIVNFIVSSMLIRNFFTVFPNNYYFICCILLLATFTVFILDTFNSDKILVISKYYPVWVVFGLIIIYIGLAPLLLISSVAETMMDLDIFFSILFAINFIGYSTLIAGVFVAKKI